MHRMFMKYIVKLAMLLSSFMIVGCASQPKEIEALVLGSGQLNPSADQKLSPVVLEVFQLKDLRDFQSSDYFKLINTGKSESQYILSMEQFFIQPSQVVRLKMPLNDQANHIGLFAAFHNLDELRWRTTIDINRVSSFELPVLGPLYEQQFFLCIELGDLGVSTRWLSGRSEMNRLQIQAQESAAGKIPFLGCAGQSKNTGPVVSSVLGASR